MSAWLQGKPGEQRACAPARRQRDWTPLDLNLERSEHSDEEHVVTITAIAA
jgi:hypothetical protein